MWHWNDETEKRVIRKFVYIHYTYSYVDYILN